MSKKTTTGIAPKVAIVGLVPFFVLMVGFLARATGLASEGHVLREGLIWTFALCCLIAVIMFIIALIFSD